jgi:hypothetical protein
VLLVSLGTIGYFLFGVGSLLGLVVAAVAAVVSVQMLYRLEPRSAGPPAD